MRRRWHKLQQDEDAVRGVGPGGAEVEELTDELAALASPSKRARLVRNKENAEPINEVMEGVGGDEDEDEDEDKDEEDEDKYEGEGEGEEGGGEEGEGVYEQVDEILGDVRNYNHGGVNFNHATTCVYMAKVVDLLLPDRFKRDSADGFWSCATDTNTWSTSDSLFTELVRKLESHQDRIEKKNVFLQLVYAYSNERASKLKKELANIHGDRTFHEKLDRTLMSGQLAFRNGYLLDLSSTVPSFDSLTPEHYVSVTGTIDRDLPKYDDFCAKWHDDTTLEELERMIRKNFCDEASYRQVMERLAWAIRMGLFKNAARQVKHHHIASPSST